MGLLTVNKDFEKLWGEPLPTISFDNETYPLSVTEGNEVAVDFTVEVDINGEETDITDECVYTLNNDYLSVQNDSDTYYFVTSDALEAGEYTTIVTATYNYKSATITATATINITVASATQYKLQLYVDKYPFEDSVGNTRHEDITEGLTLPPQTSHCDVWEDSGDTIEIDNVTYYIWNYVGYNYDFSDKQPSLLTTTNDYNTLRNQSIEVSGDNAEFSAGYGYATIDSDTVEVYTDFSNPLFDVNDDEYYYQLLKVIRLMDPLMTIYVDKFPPQGEGEIDYADLGYTREEFMQDEVEYPNDYHPDEWKYYGDTLEYNDNEYYLWEATSLGGFNVVHPTYLLTTTDDYEELENESLEDDVNNTFISLYGYTLTGDFSDIYIQEDLTEITKRYLVKVINNSSDEQIDNTAAR